MRASPRSLHSFPSSAHPTPLPRPLALAAALHATRRNNPLQRAPIATACLVAVMLAVLTPSALAQSIGASTDPRRYELPAMSLDAALAQLARQAGLRLQADPALLRGQRGHAVAPIADLDAALRSLLSGSGLTASVSGGAIVIAGGTSGEQVLPVVKVRASAIKSPDTRDTYLVDNTSTATGLPLSLRETPQSVSVITAERIQDQSITTVGEALRHTLGLSVKAVDRGRNQVYARGFEVNNFQYDGLPVATGNIGIETLNAAPYDRFEVVKGATGLTSGAGDPSAAVNLVRKHADSRTFTGSVNLEVGSWGRLATTADLTVPLTADGSIRGRVVAQAYKQDSFVDLESKKGSVVYGIVDADFGPGTSLSVGASQQVDKRSGVLWTQLPYWYADGTRTNWPREQTTATNWNQWDTRETIAFASLKQRIAGDWTLRADVNWREQHEDSMLLWMWGNLDANTGLGLQAWPYHYQSTPEQIDAHVSASGSFRVFGRRHDATFGAQYNQLDDGWLNQDPIGPVAPVGDFREWDGSYPEPAMGPFYRGSGGRTTQAAVYAAAKLHVAEPLKLILGGRFSKWKRVEDPAFWTGPMGYTVSQDAFTPYAGLVFDLTRQMSAYASYTNSFKPQTVKDKNGAYLDPLLGKAMEAGMKGEWLDGRLLGTAAVFRTDQDNFAIADGFQIDRPTEPAFRTAQGVKVQGFELELTGQLKPGWDVTAGFTQFTARDAAGNDVALDHAREQLKLFTTYELRSWAPGLKVGGGVDWESRALTKATNPSTGVVEDIGQGAYALWSLMASYEVTKQFSVQFNVDNLFDKTYREGNPWWTNGFVYGEPRSVTLSATYEF